MNLQEFKTMTNKLTEQQQKRFDEKMEHEFHDCAAHDQGQYCCLDKEHKRNQNIKQHLADEIARAEKKAVEGFVRLLLYPQELENTHPDLKSFNQLVNYRYQVYSQYLCGRIPKKTIKTKKD